MESVKTRKIVKNQWARQEKSTPIQNKLSDLILRARQKKSTHIQNKFSCLHIKYLNFRAKFHLLVESAVYSFSARQKKSAPMQNKL